MSLEAVIVFLVSLEYVEEYFRGVFRAQTNIYVGDFFDNIVKVACLVNIKLVFTD